MKNILSILALCWLLIACSQSEDAPAPSRLTVWADSLDIALPEGINQLDSLKVIPPDQKPLYEIEFVREQVFLPGDDILFSDLATILIDDQERVHIKNGSWIHTYRADGTYLSAMGGTGRGPGEHSGFGIAEFIMHQNRLLTYDRNLHRINIFSLETLRPSGTLMMDQTNWKIRDDGQGMYPGMSYVRRGAYFPLNDSLLLIRFTVPARMSQLPSEGYELSYYGCDYYALDYDGNLVPEKVMEAECPVQVSTSGIHTEFLPIFSRPLIKSNGNGRIYTASSAHFLFKMHNSMGTYQKALYHPMKAEPVNKETYIDQSTHQRQRELLQESDLPPRWPVLKSFLVDDENRIWAATVTEDEQALRWMIVDEDGTFIAEFEWPGDRMAGSDRISIRAIKNGVIYTYEETPGDEIDLPEKKFVRYRFTLNPVSESSDYHEIAY